MRECTWYEHLFRKIDTGEIHVYSIYLNKYIIQYCILVYYIEFKEIHVPAHYQNVFYCTINLIQHMSANKLSYILYR